jgi:hypothetical protein
LRGAPKADAPKHSIAFVGIDIGKNSFHVVGLDEQGAIVLRQKWSRGQVEARFSNMPPCLIGMEACVGAHHLSRGLQKLGHDARLMLRDTFAPIQMNMPMRFIRLGCCPRAANGQAAEDAAPPRRPGQATSRAP